MSCRYLPLVALVSCSAAPPPRPEPIAPRDPVELRAITFRTDDGRAVPAELGRLRVRENRRTGGARTIELAFVRFRADAPTRVAPIVYLAGGPGAGGTEHARGPRFALVMALRAVADVIVLDQRGTGLSQRLPPCPDRWSIPLDVPATRERLEAEVLRHARACAESWRADGVDLDAYNTEESADDIDELRRAIGAPRINLVGASYGTHLGLAVIRRHGRFVERAIFAGVEGPDSTVKLPSDQEAVLRRVAALVAADPEAARAYPDFLPGLAELLERLDREPAIVTIDPATRVALTRLDVARLVAGALHGPATIKLLPRVVWEMRRGDFSSILPRMAALRSDSLDAMSAAMDAASGSSAERLAQIRREHAETLLGDAINIPYDAVHTGLGVRDLGPAFRSPVRSEVPVLLISGTLDGRTPPRNAEQVRVGFPHSAHVVLDGVGHGHGLFLASPAIAELGLAFLSGEPVADRTIAVPAPRFELPGGGK